MPVCRGQRSAKGAAVTCTRAREGDGNEVQRRRRWGRERGKSASGRMEYWKQKSERDSEAEKIQRRIWRSVVSAVEHANTHTQFNHTMPLPDTLLQAAVAGNSSTHRTAAVFGACAV